MLVFAGLLSNSPLLLPSINGTRLAEVEKTREAMNELSEELYAVHPDVIVVLAESKVMYPDAFSINVADPYISDLAEFGDLGYNKTYHPDFGLVDKIQRRLRTSPVPVSLSTDDRLDFATVVPLDFLAGHLPEIRIVPIAPSSLEPKAHFTFGTYLKELIQEHDKRVAVIAAGDLSHALTKESPAGYEKNAEEFDQTMLTHIRGKNTAGLLQLSPNLLKSAHDTLYRQTCTLFGVLDGYSITPSVLSYEAPFGVGYCVTNFILS